MQDGKAPSYFVVKEKYSYSIVKPFTIVNKLILK